MHDRVLRWDIPLPEGARHYAAQIVERPQAVAGDQSVLEPRAPQLAPGVLRAGRRSRGAHAWHAGRADRRSQRARAPDGRGHPESHGRSAVSNTIGQDTLPAAARAASLAPIAVLTPDSGPAHMATAMGTPVIGLYAATNPERSGPYFSRSWCVNRYQEAAQKYLRAPGQRASLDHQDREEGRDGPDPAARCHAQARPADAPDRQAPQAVGLTPMNNILVPISPGELLDKITILRIKSQRMTDRDKVANVRHELELLEHTWSESARKSGVDVSAEERALEAVNARLWDIEDDIRDKESQQRLRRPVHRAGARGLHQQRRTRGDQAAHQPEARLEDRRRKILQGLPSGQVDHAACHLRRTGRRATGSSSPACTPRRSKGTSPSPSARSAGKRAGGSSTGTSAASGRTAADPRASPRTDSAHSVAARSWARLERTPEAPRGGRRDGGEV